MRKTYRVKLSELVSDYNKDYAIANLSHSFTGYDPQFTEGNGFITFAVNTDEHLTNEIIREKLSSSTFVSAVSSGDYKKRVVKVPQLKQAEKILPYPKGNQLERHVNLHHDELMTLDKAINHYQDMSAKDFEETFGKMDDLEAWHSEDHERYGADHEHDHSWIGGPNDIKEAGQGSWNREQSIWRPAEFKGTPSPNPMSDKQKRKLFHLFSERDYSAHPYAGTFAFHEKTLQEKPQLYSKGQASQLINAMLEFPYKEGMEPKEAATESTYPDFAHGKGINGSPLTDTASNNPFTTEQGRSGVDANLHIPDTENVQYIIDQDNIRNPANDKRFSSWVIAKEEEKEEKKVDQYGLPIPDEEDGLPKGRTLSDLWGGIGGMGTSNDKSGNS